MALAATPTPAAAQSSLNLNAHCQDHHGPHARAIARNRNDAYSWGFVR